MFKRMKERSQSQGLQRSDDTNDIFKRRVETFENSTRKIITRFKEEDRLITIDGETTPFEILADYLEILQELSESESEE